MASDPQTLFEQAKCFGCYGASSVDLLKLALLDQIAAGGSGSCLNLSGVASPLNVITPDFVGQVYVQADGTVWQAGSLLAASWVSICSPGGGGAGFLGSTIGTLIFNLQSDDSDTSISFPNLIAFPDDVFIALNPALVSISAPLVVSAATISWTQNPVLASVNLDSLVSLTGSLVFTDSALTSLNLPALTTILAGFNFSVEGNPIVSLSIPNLIFGDPAFLNCFGCALDAASVNLILARCVASGLTTSTIDISTGTSAAPSGQGIIDKAALILAGNTVFTN
jgi:hypothetical protein